ncbi:MAG: DinB family protein, partial [Candidatus Acidiferrum sp.]
QCVSEDLWFRTMLKIDVGAPPLPKEEIRNEFIRRYVEDSGKRLTELQRKDEGWWESETDFFDVKRSMAWVLTRRIAHTSHHRGQQMAMLRMLGHGLHSNYGPTADTGGLMQNHAPTIYAYESLNWLLADLEKGTGQARLPGSGGKPVTERAAQE